ncbi:uncharacterized protein PGTG_01886 [Puccinia graminis f. sp. tritici CRL 75-36-700-3]|uniref:Uncharacterized protein n=1 Tax=Puccinia graminis f. sp. tritici (strain CRL 75-36-700-3 / race SCCL) TaxID=418459 RepID=E3JTG8_PUCGT|nr:uncharacterized protein PGTG_01886 [Puccinia graminis f. sp. tritici CRL 75-36-700-3]EFP75293.2 hypothetical protein PGTG_01886 [Puccinia graminis f. sp. tritici CRL 75-36-700-3]
MDGCSGESEGWLLEECLLEEYNQGVGHNCKLAGWLDGWMAGWLASFVTCGNPQDPQLRLPPVKNAQHEQVALEICTGRAVRPTLAANFFVKVAVLPLLQARLNSNTIPTHTGPFF